MEDKIYRQFCRAAGEERVRVREPMRGHTTFRIGGPADYFISPDTAEQLQEVLKICRETETPWFILGNGSNLLVSDQGYRGAVIQIYKNFQKIEVQGEELQAQAGALLSAIAARALAEELTGMEFASGIPGTLGGAVVMNAGAYGGEMKSILKDALLLKPDGELCRLSAEELELGYRTSRVKREGMIVLEAALRLQKGSRDTIRARMEELKNQRCSKQPLEYPSAGSTFKRPEGYFAGKLIMDAGLRGFSVGGAQVSEKHCGFVINRGDATAADVQALIREIQERVWDQFQVKLEPEIRFLGDF